VSLSSGREVNYDYLVIATGARHGYFGKDAWEKYAPGLKSISDATGIREKILAAFEAAEMELDPERQKELLTFVLVGGGPTGVEMAGAISELANRSLVKDFRRIDPKSTKVILVEAGPRILTSFPEALSKNAEKNLKKLGVEVWLGARVENIDENGAWINGKQLRSPNVIWTAGVVASPAAKWLQAEADKAGRVKVTPELTLPGHPEIFVIGDTASAMDKNGKPLPGVAPVALQQGAYVAKKIAHLIKGKKETYPFSYWDKGNLATIGRRKAIADVKGFHLTGFFAWVTWLVVHIYFLIGFRNRVFVLFNWAWAYFTFQRGARLIVDENLAVLGPHGKEGTPHTPSVRSAAETKPAATDRV
jgi:NADH dehydrogenase